MDFRVLLMKLGISHAKIWPSEVFYDRIGSRTISVADPGRWRSGMTKYDMSFPVNGKRHVGWLKRQKILDTPCRFTMPSSISSWRKWHVVHVTLTHVCVCSAHVLTYVFMLKKLMHRNAAGGLKQRAG